MMKLHSTILGIMLGCLLGRLAPAWAQETAPRQDPKQLVVEACDKIRSSSGHHFKIDATIELGEALSSSKFSITLEGVCKNPDLYRVSGSLMGQPFTVYRRSQVAVSKGSQFGGGAAGWNRLPAEATKMVFTPFYESADLAKFLGGAGFADDDEVDGRKCTVVLAPIPQSQLDEAFDISKTSGAVLGGGDMSLKGAIYRFWIGKDDGMLYRVRRNIAYEVEAAGMFGGVPPAETGDEGEQAGQKKGKPSTLNVIVDAKLFDYNKDVDFEIPDAARAAMERKEDERPAGGYMKSAKYYQAMARVYALERKLEFFEKELQTEKDEIIRAWLQKRVASVREEVKKCREEAERTAAPAEDEGAKEPPPPVGVESAEGAWSGAVEKDGTWFVVTETVSVKDTLRNAGIGAREAARRKAVEAAVKEALDSAEKYDKNAAVINDKILAVPQNYIVSDEILKAQTFNDGRYYGLKMKVDVDRPKLAKALDEMGVGR